MSEREGTTERAQAPREVMRFTLFEEDEPLGLTSRHLEVVTWETDRKPMLLREAFDMLKAMIEADPSTRSGPIVPEPPDWKP